MRVVLLILALGLLAACGGGEKGVPPAGQLQFTPYAHPEPASLTLITVINNRSGQGGHSSLLISGSQRLLFDPAGSFRHESMPEYGDVLYGITPQKLRLYKRAHARSTYHVVSQEIPVSPQVAEMALGIVQANGSVASGFCSVATSSVLRQLPGFQDVPSSLLPHKLMEHIARRPGVREERFYENDAGDILDGIAGLNLGQQIE